MIAVHFENLLFLLLLAVAFLFQLLTKAASKASRDQTKRASTSTRGMPPPSPHAPTESDAERIRKFLEALGQPPTSRPPPPVVPRTDIPLRPVAPVRPSPIPTLRNILTRKTRQVFETPKTPRAASSFEIHEAPPPLAPTDSIKSPVEAYAMATAPKAKVTGSGADIATLLHSTAGLRNAIIVREIFGPPRSLQPFDPIRSA